MLAPQSPNIVTEPYYLSPWKSWVSHEWTKGLLVLIFPWGRKQAEKQAYGRSLLLYGYITSEYLQKHSITCPFGWGMECLSYFEGLKCWHWLIKQGPIKKIDCIHRREIYYCTRVSWQWQLNLIICHQESLRYPLSWPKACYYWLSHGWRYNVNSRITLWQRGYISPK